MDLSVKNIGKSVTPLNYYCLSIVILINDILSASPVLSFRYLDV